MAENYTVNYQINVNSNPALQAIKKFQEATAGMEHLVRRFDAVAKGVGKVNSALSSINSKSIQVNVDTSKAEAGLNRVLSLLNQIKTASTGAVRVTSGTKGTTSVGGMTPLNTRVATSNLKNLTSTIASTQTAINNINKRYIHPKADTKIAQTNLDRLLTTLRNIKGLSNINVSVTGGAAHTTTSTNTGAVPMVRIAPEKGAGHSAYLYPTTRQVLGPTYANTGANVAGEMIKGMGIAYGLSSLMTGVGNVFRDATAYDNISKTTYNILKTHDTSSIGFDGRFNEMNQLMREVGVDTRFTAPQVAEAGKFLAMAGFNVDQIKQAIRPITDIALIGDTDLGETADVVTNIMTSYKIPAQQMSNAADILTMTFTKTNTTLMELAESFKYAGTVANQAGLSFETSSAAFGILGDAGIKGSQAGTTMRMMLLNMINPTKKQRAAWESVGIRTKDENGNLRNFIEILQDLNNKSQTMTDGAFSTLISQMFRVTAAPGALALINSVDKLQKVTDKNYQSSGLASSLALEKQNTSHGLWHQMTSAFTESGMQGFEQMQSAVRDFLQEMIALMKSPDFAKALRDMMNMFMEIANGIVGVFKGIGWIWNLIPDWGKTAVAWFVRIQMSLGIVANVAQSLMSTFIMIRGIFMGNWLAIAIGKFGKLATTLMNLTKIYASARFLGLSKAGSVMQALGQGLFGGAATTTTATVAAGAGGAATGGGMSLLSALGKGAKWLLTTGFGHAWLGIGAVTALGVAIYNAYQTTMEARRANEAWAESYRQLGVDKLNLAEPDALLIGNMRIFNNELFTHNERISQSIDLYKQWWKEKNAGVTKIDDATPYSNTDAGSLWGKNIKAADQWFGVHNTFMPLVNTLGGQVSYEMVNGEKWGYVTLNGQKLPMNTAPLGSTATIGEAMAVQLALAQYGADPNNKTRLDLERYLNSQAISAHSYKDYMMIMENARKRYFPTKWDSQWDYGISSEIAEKMSEKDIANSQSAVLALQKNLESVFVMYDSLGEFFNKADNSQNIAALDVQHILMERFGDIFDPNYGLFGSNGWMKHISDMIADPKKYNYDSMQQVIDRVTLAFTEFTQLYNLLDVKYRPYFSGFLNRSVWEGVLPNGAKLPDGGYYGGKKLGDKMTVNGQAYTWSQLGPDAFPVWRDKDGNIYSPTDGGKTNWAQTVNSNNPLYEDDDQSGFKDRYTSTSAAPKQVIVRIENLMNVQNIDLTDERKTAVLANLKDEVATLLLDVVQDFNANMS